jgi:hypothetical protein
MTKQMRRNLRYFWPRAESNLYAEAKRLVDEGLAEARLQYLRVEDPFPERVHVNVLVYRLPWDYVETELAWAAWALASRPMAECQAPGGSSGPDESA